MLVHAQTKQIITITKGKKPSEMLLRACNEHCVPATHKGHSFFRLDQRAVFKQ